MYIVLVLFIFILFIGFLFSVTAFSYLGLFHLKVKTDEEIHIACLESGEVSQADFDLPWIKQEIESPFGYKLQVYALEGKGSGQKGIAIFHHGGTWSWAATIYYMKQFIAKGWTVVSYDSRGHGATRKLAMARQNNGRIKKQYPSFGYYEKTDFLCLANWARSTFPNHSGFVAMGESMGASTILHYAPLDPHLDAIIADSPFANVEELLYTQLRIRKIPGFLARLVIAITDFLCKKNLGFSFIATSPEKDIIRTAVPLLLIHGQKDSLVPWQHSARIADQRRKFQPKAITELLLIPEAGHVWGIRTDPDVYLCTMWAFIEKSLQKKNSES